MAAELWDNYGIKVERVPANVDGWTKYRIIVGDCQVDLTGQEFKIFMTETLATARSR